MQVFSGRWTEVTVDWTDRADRVWLFSAKLPAGQTAGFAFILKLIFSFYFLPQHAHHVAAIKAKFGLRPALHQISSWLVQKRGDGPPETDFCEFLGTYSPCTSVSLARFLQNFSNLWALPCCFHTLNLVAFAWQMQKLWGFYLGNYVYAKTFRGRKLRIRWSDHWKLVDDTDFLHYCDRYDGAQTGHAAKKRKVWCFLLYLDIWRDYESEIIIKQNIIMNVLGYHRRVKLG